MGFNGVASFHNFHFPSIICNEMFSLPSPSWSEDPQKISRGPETQIRGGCAHRGAASLGERSKSVALRRQTVLVNSQIPACQLRFFPGFVVFLAAKCWLVIELVPLNPGTFSSQGHLHAGAEGFYPCSPALPPLSQVCAAAAAPCGPATRGWWTTSSPRTQR